VLFASTKVRSFGEQRGMNWYEVWAALEAPFGAVSPAGTCTGASGCTLRRRVSIQHEAFLADEADTGVDRSGVPRRPPVLQKLAEGCLNARCRPVRTVR